MAKDRGYSWCPECKKWVPEDKMNYDVDESTGALTRVCTYCLEGTSRTNRFVVDEHHEDVRCIYCKGWDTVETTRKHFKCNTCNKEFVYV